LTRPVEHSTHPARTGGRSDEFNDLQGGAQGHVTAIALRVKGSQCCRAKMDAGGQGTDDLFDLCDRQTPGDRNVGRAGGYLRREGIEVDVQVDLADPTSERLQLRTHGTIGLALVPADQVNVIA